MSLPLDARCRQAILLPVVIALGVGFAAMRVVGVLGAAPWRALLPLGFVLMALTPWLLLRRGGRVQIGLVAPRHRGGLLAALAVGVGAALACFAIGLLLFGTSADHWFVSIASSYRRTMDTTGFAPWQLHLTFTLPAVLFSPIGEEIYFRGLLQRTLEDRLGARTATALECGAFGIVHHFHHGLYRGPAGLGLHPLSGAVWVLLMAATAWAFATVRRRTGSVYPAMAAHAAFNVTMNVAIFAALWR